MKTELKTIVTVGPCRIAYAHTFKARHNDLSEKDEYSCVLLIPKDECPQNPDPKATAKTISELVKAVAQEAGLKGDWRNPFKDGDKDLNSHGEPRHPGYWFIAAKTGADYPPMNIDYRRVPIGEESGFVSGDWAKASIKIAAYDAKVNKGVTAYLRGLQWLHKDEPFGRSALDDFADESGSVAKDGDDFDPFAD